jgi:hypothetical protein
MNFIKRKYQLFKARRSALTEKQFDKRPDQIYSYLAMIIEDITRKRPLTTGQYEVLMAMMLGNVVARQINRHTTSGAFKRVEKLARLLVNSNMKEGVG